MIKIIFLLLPLLAFSYTKSDHFDGKIFHNPDGDDLKSFWQVLKWKLGTSAVPWPSHVPIKNFPVRAKAPNEKLSLTFINHSTFLIEVDGLNILTDPIYSERASPVSFAGPKRVREPGRPFDFLPPIDVVIISHNHYDHLDLPTIQDLDKKFHPLFIVPLGDEKTLLDAGVQNVKALDWWEEVRVKNTRFIFAPAKHWSARSLWNKNKSLWGSFMIDNGPKKIYFAGDTGFGNHFTEIKKRLGPPDIALIPIGAYKPEWFMKFYHTNPEEAVKAHLDLEAKKTFAMHFGTFQMSNEGIDEPERDLKLAMKNLNVSEEDFQILEHGQTFFY